MPIPNVVPGFLVNNFGHNRAESDGGRRLAWLLLFLILISHALVSTIHISNQGITTDERAYYIYGIRWLHGNVERVELQDDSKSPFTAISAIPRSVIQLFNPNYKASDNGREDLLMGRHFMEFYTWIIAIYFFIWCRKLFGEDSWILPLLFFLFDPMVIAFSMILVSDMATGACVIAVFYHLYRYYETRLVRHFIYMGIGLGLGCVVKPSLLFLFPCIGILYLFLLAARLVHFNLKKLAIGGLTAFIIVVFIINCLYFFHDSFRLLGSVETRSAAFNTLLNKFSFLKSMPLPVPETYYASVDLLQYHKELGGGTPESSYPGVYLNGIYKMQGGFWYYYLMVAWYKLPLATIILFAFTLMAGMLRFNARHFFDKHIWYVFPAFFFLLVLSFFNSFQIGLRHILMIYPMFFLGVAGFLVWIKSRFRWAAIVAWALFASMIISETIYFPHLVPYTNEMIAEKKMVYKKMNDSNIDYSQSLEEIPAYIKNNPEVRLPPLQPRQGNFIIGMQQLNPYNVDTATTRSWLQNFEPTKHINYSLLLYNITTDDLKRKGFK